MDCNSAVHIPPAGKPPQPSQTIPFSGLKTEFTFNTTNISGTVNVNNQIYAAGSVSVVASGKGCDNAEFGHGEVDAKCSALVGVIITPTPGANANITCDLKGSYDRVGSHVWVNLKGQICVNNVCGNVKVDVEAEFVPITVAPCAGYPQCVTQAAFVGVYAQTET